MLLERLFYFFGTKLIEYAYAVVINIHQLNSPHAVEQRISFSFSSSVSRNFILNFLLITLFKNIISVLVCGFGIQRQDCLFIRSLADSTKSIERKGGGYYFVIRSVECSIIGKCMLKYFGIYCNCSDIVICYIYISGPQMRRYKRWSI